MELKEKLHGMFESAFCNETEEHNAFELTLKEWNFVWFNDWELKEKEFESFISSDDIWWFQVDLLRQNYSSYGLPEDKLDELVGVELDRLQAEGHLDYSVDLKDDVKLRINWSLGWWKHIMRVRRLQNKIATPQELWIPPEIVKTFKTHKTGGVVIVSARPWSWKSTTLFSVLSQICRDETINLVTLEDPIEFVYDNVWTSFVQQRELRKDFPSYEKAIEGCMRQTPDIVMIQEVRSPAVLRTAMDLAEKWVMVVFTLHNWDPKWVVENIVSSYPEEMRDTAKLKVWDLIKAIISQKLIKDVWGNNIPVFEYLFGWSSLKWALRSWWNIKSMMHNFPNKPMYKSLWDLCNAGVISREEATSNCQPDMITYLNQEINYQ